MRGYPSLQDVLDKLSKVRESGEGYSALCPAHDDNKPSLSISTGEDGRILIHCFAGCETSDVLYSMGLQFRDLFLR